VELKRRERAERDFVPLEEVVARVQAEIAALHSELRARTVEMPYDG
jgi:hypothetical protein